MIKFKILSHLASNITSQDTYRDAEFKLRSFMTSLRDSGELEEFDVRSDPAGPEYTVYWTASGTKRYEKLRVDPKNIDRNLVTVMEVLES